MARGQLGAVPVEGVIFDLDGTLIDYEGASHKALAAPLERRGKAFTWETHANIVGTKPEDWSRNVLSAVGLSADVITPEQYAEEYFREVHGLYSSIPAWPGTLELLARLKERGFPMAIATSSPKASFDEKMKHHPEIIKAMSAVVTGDEVSRGKPSPDIFLEAAKRLGVRDPSRCVVFEDSPAGLEAARLAGMASAALPDPRMQAANAHKFEALKPRWLLTGGIGEFDHRDLELAPGAPTPLPGRCSYDVLTGSGPPPCPPAVAPEEEEEERARIVLFGDSITQQSFGIGGFGARLADRYQRRADVLNRGYSGYNTRWAAQLSPKLLRETAGAAGAAGQAPGQGPAPGQGEKRGPVTLVVLFFGANDASLAEHNPRQHVPLGEYKATLASMAQQFASSGQEANVLVVTPPPVCHAQRLEFQKSRFPGAATGVLERTLENAGLYAGAAEAAAQELGLPCLNLWREMQEAEPGGAWSGYLSDGLHLSAAGNEFVASKLVAKIEAHFPTLAVLPCPHTGSFGNSGSRGGADLRVDAPWHDAIDPGDVPGSFKRPFKKRRLAEVEPAAPDLTGN